MASYLEFPNQLEYKFVTFIFIKTFKVKKANIIYATQITLIKLLSQSKFLNIKR